MSLLSRNCPTVTWLLGIEIFFPLPRLLIDMKTDVDELLSKVYKGKREEEGQLEEPAQIPGYKRAGSLASPRQCQPRVGNTCTVHGTVSQSLF